jgi:hypothetical protein
MMGIHGMIQVSKATRNGPEIIMQVNVKGALVTCTD